MAALLTSVGDNKDKSAVYLSECRRSGIKVLPPDVNESGLRFAAVGTDIRFGLGAVRNVGANVVESIIKTREDKGAVHLVHRLPREVGAGVLQQARRRVADQGRRVRLARAHPARRCVQVHEEAVDAVVGLKRQEAMGQFDLFGGDDDHAGGDRRVPAGAPARSGDEEWPRKQLLAYEREMLGLYVSAHPLDGAERILRKHAPKPIAAIIDDAPKEGEIVLAGMISSLDRRVNKKGEPWAICTIEDLDASIEVLFFPKSYSVLYAGPGRGRRGRGEGPGQLARGPDVGLRLRPDPPGHHRRRPDRPRRGRPVRAAVQPGAN